MDGTMKDKWKTVLNVMRDYALACYARTAVCGGSIPFGETAQTRQSVWRVGRGERHKTAHGTTGSTVVAAVPASSFEMGPPTQDEVAIAIATLARRKSEGFEGA